MLLKVNKKVGSLLILESIGENRYSVLCDCGVSTIVGGWLLTKSDRPTCEFCREKVPLRNFSGERRGSLLVLRPLGKMHGKRNGRAEMHYLCRCDCGVELPVRQQYLQRGKMKSCGCSRQGNKNYGWKGHGEIAGQYWTQMKKGARERNLDFDLKLEDIWDLFLKQKRLCALTGQELIMFRSWKIMGTASLDRIDSSKGYTLDNVQWVHKDINQMKLNHTEDYFIKLCKLVASYR